ncbi:MAG: methyltransferase domain-containing protein [Mariprofundales bacterium]|nr:methyltransferase domain-containing protein [Mariprofundales bacterium]
MKDWESLYQQGDTKWDRGTANAALPHLIAQLTPGASVLVPGCGRGHEVVELATNGFAVTALDIAPSAISHLASTLAQHQLHARLVRNDLFAFTPDQPFDAIYEQTCLCAIDPTQRHDYELRLHRWLKPGGLLFALFMQTNSDDGPPFHCDLPTMRRLFAEKSWQWPTDVPQSIPHSNGRFELAHTLQRI